MKPKMDGFRGQLWRREGTAAQLLSRSGRDLVPWFPELIRAAEVVPGKPRLDGEIVIADDRGQADFAALQHRLTLGAKVHRRSHPGPACRPSRVRCARTGGEELVSRPLVDRRQTLERLLDGVHPCLRLVAHTTDHEIAEGWLGVPGLEGLVAKRLDRPYVAGRARDWIKVKRQRTIECAVVGVCGVLASPRWSWVFVMPTGACTI
jgi:ATP-dependent DNA ligase